MDESRLFLRQIHTLMLDDDGPQSCAFRPTPKDSGKLSGYDGERVSPAEAFEHYTHTLGLASAAVFGVSEGECLPLALFILDSPTAANPFHVHLDFSFADKAEARRFSKALRDHAVARGRLHPPIVSTGGLAPHGN